MNVLRRHQQDVPGPGQLALAACGITLLAGDDQADVIFQVKVPRKGKLRVARIDQEYAWMPGGLVNDAIQLAGRPPLADLIDGRGDAATDDHQHLLVLLERCCWRIGQGQRRTAGRFDQNALVSKEPLASIE
ncbi:hypothetical protein D9M71_675830 [compost metagenome]